MLWLCYVCILCMCVCILMRMGTPFLNTPVASDIDADVLQCVIYLCPKRATLRIHTISQSLDPFRSIIVNICFSRNMHRSIRFSAVSLRTKAQNVICGVHVLFETGAVSVECVLGQDYLITWTVWVFVMRQLFIAWRASQVQGIECNYARLSLVM